MLILHIPIDKRPLTKSWRCGGGSVSIKQGISSSVIWERLTVEEQAAYIRALNTQSQPEAEF